MNKKVFLYSTLTSYISMMVNILANILIVPILMNGLGQFSYGIWITLITIFGALGVTDLGMGQSITKLIAQYSNDPKRTNYINTVVSTTFSISSVIGIIIILVNIMISFYIGKFMHFNSSSIQFVYIILSINFFLGFTFGSTYNNILIGYKKIYVSNIINILKSIILLISTIIIFKMHGSLKVLSVIYLGITILSILVSRYTIRKSLKSIKIKYSLYDKKLFKVIFSPGVYYFILQISCLIIYNTDNIVLSYFVGASIVALYASTYKIIDIFMKLVFTATDNLFPFISEMEGDNNLNDIKKMNINSSKYSLGFGIFLSTMFIFFSENIMNIWLGSGKFIGNAVVFTFCASLIINSITHNSAIYISALYKHKAISMCTIIEATMNLILSIVLVRKFGTIGVAIGTLIASLLNSAWFVPYYCCRVLKIRIMDYFHKVLLSNGIILVLFSALLFIETNYLLTVTTILILISVYLVNFIIYLGIYYLFVLDKIERLNLLAYINKLKMKILGSNKVSN